MHKMLAARRLLLLLIRRQLSTVSNRPFVKTFTEPEIRLAESSRCLATTPTGTNRAPNRTRRIEH